MAAKLSAVAAEVKSANNKVEVASFMMAEGSWRRLQIYGVWMSRGSREKGYILKLSVEGRKARRIESAEGRYIYLTRR
jgi:hypothetical protein